MARPDISYPLRGQDKTNHATAPATQSILSGETISGSIEFGGGFAFSRYFRYFAGLSALVRRVRELREGGSGSEIRPRQQSGKYPSQPRTRAKNREHF